MADHIRASQVRRDDKLPGHPREDPLPPKEEVAGHREGSRGLTSPSRHAHLRRYWTVGAIRRCLRHAVRGGSGPSESHPLQPGRAPPCKGTDDSRTATLLGDVAWAAAGVLGPQGTSEGTKVAAFPRYCAPQTGSAAAGGHRGVATRKATGDPATHGGAGDPASEKEQCVGTCGRGLEEGAAHSRCVTPPLHSLVRAVAAE